MNHYEFLKQCKPVALLSSILLLSGCGGGSSPASATFTATFSPATLNLQAASNVQGLKKLKDGNQLVVTTTKAISNPAISFADDTQTGKASLFSITGCSPDSGQMTTTCTVTSTDTKTETVYLKVMVSDGTTTVQATPPSGASSSDITIIRTVPPSPPPPSGLCSFTAGASNPCPFPERANSAWLYDGSIACTGLDISSTKDGVSSEYLIDPGATCSTTMTPGANISSVVNFNTAMNSASHTNDTLGINEVNVYAGDIEFLNDDLQDPDSELKGFSLDVKDKHTGTEVPYDGSINIARYNALKTQSPQIQHIMAVVDGRHDALGVPNGWLWQSYTYNNSLISHNYNNLSPADAVTFADHIAEQFCNTNNGGPSAADVDGVQFDLESFHIPADTETLPAVCDPDDATFNPGASDCANLTGWGQYLFYREMSKDLAGQNTVDSALINGATGNTCSITHPKFFTLFDFPNLETKEHLAKLLNSYSNGYAIFSLYDLGGSGVPVGDGRLYNGSAVDMNTARAGFVASSPAYYNTALAQEMTLIQQQISAAPIYFQVGIPAAASAHEFSYSESPAYDTGKTDDRYASSTPSATGSPIYPDCATGDTALAVNTAGVGCATDSLSADSYQESIVGDAMTATRELLTATTISPYYVGLNLWAFNPANNTPAGGEVLANNHWIPRASSQDSLLAFPDADNIPDAFSTNGGTPTKVTDQNKYVLCHSIYLDVPGYTDYLDNTYELVGGCSYSYAGPGKTPLPFKDDGSYSHTPDQYVGMRFYYPNSVYGATLTGTNPDVASENTQETNVFNTLKSYEDLMSTTVTHTNNAVHHSK
jgi:hypothetical protein